MSTKDAKSRPRVEVKDYGNLGLWTIELLLPGGFIADVRTVRNSQWSTEKRALNHALKLGELMRWPVYWRGSVVTFQAAEKER